MKNKVLAKVVFACLSCSDEDVIRYLDVDGTLSVYDDYLTQEEVDYLTDDEETNEKLLDVIFYMLKYRLDD